jgi:hypothetical protein
MAFRLFLPLCGNSNSGWRSLLVRDRLRLRRWVRKIVETALDCSENAPRQVLDDSEVFISLASCSGHQVSGGDHGEKTETHCTEEFQDSAPCLLAVIFVNCCARRQRDAQSKVKMRILPIHTDNGRRISDLTIWVMITLHGAVSCCCSVSIPARTELQRE